MNKKMMTHVSDLLHIQRCPKLAWNYYHKKQTPLHYFHMIEPYSSLWKRYLKIEEAPHGEVGDTNEATLQKMKGAPVYLHARFSYRECRTQIPILIKKPNGYHAIYPYLNSTVHESEALRFKLNQMIAKQCGINIVSHEVILIQKDYVRQESLDLDSLFFRSDCFFNRRNHPSKPIQEVLDALNPDLETMIQDANVLFEQEAITMQRNKQCTAGRRCTFYEDCFDDSLLPDDSSLFLTTSQYKLEAFQKGIKHIQDMDLSMIEGSRLQYAQVMASRYGLFIDRCALQTWFQQIQYPISYLDFEWDTFGIPPYPGMKPFDVLCFQYSLHIEDRDQMLDHRDFFGVQDCREAFIRSLIDNLPKSGSILVYNMEGAEKLRLLQLAQQFPQYQKALVSICDRMVDLSKPFETGVYYENRMRGHYSLKNILPLFTDEVSYQQLAIHNGINAVMSYRTFDLADKSEQRKISQDIRNYCRMDTYAEYIVYHGLLKKLKEE